MSVSSAPHPPSAIVARLRAAGCVFAEDEARLLVAAARTPAELAAMVGPAGRRAAARAGTRLGGVLRPADRRGPRGLRAAPAHRVPRPPGRRRPPAAARPDQPAPASGARTVVVDLCCGSGAVGAALAAARTGRSCTPPTSTPPRWTAPAATSPPAAQVYEGDLYEPLPAALRGRVDILAANVPYVPTEEVGLLPPEARITSRGRAGRRRGRARRPAAGSRGGAAVAGSRRLPAGRDQRTPGAAGRRRVREQRSGPPGARSAALHATVVTGTRPATRRPARGHPRAATR